MQRKLQENDLLSNIPKEIITDGIATQIGLQTVISSASLVCYNWHKLFTDPSLWQNKIQREFHISPAVFSNLKVDTPINYRLTYVNLLTLQQQKKLPKSISHVLRDEIYHFYLLACCSDNVDVLNNIIPKNDFAFWEIVSLYAHCRFVPFKLHENSQNLTTLEFFNEAARAGNLAIVKHILLGKTFDITPTIDSMKAAIKSRNVAVVKLLFEQNTDKKWFELNDINVDELFILPNIHLISAILSCVTKQPTKHAVINAIKTNVCELIDYFRESDPPNCFKLGNYSEIGTAAIEAANLELIKSLVVIDPKLWTSINHMGLCLGSLAKKLNFATQKGNLAFVKYYYENVPGIFAKRNPELLSNIIRSGNLELLIYFLELPFEITVTQKMLSTAGRSGSLHVVKFLLEKYNLKPDLATLHKAIKSSNYELIFFLLNPKNNFSIKPTLGTLNLAAYFGLDTIVRYLLNPIHGFELKPNQKTLEEAIRSANFELVRFLLNPKNNFGLIINETILTLATQLSEKSPFIYNYLKQPQHLVFDDDILRYKHKM